MRLPLLARSPLSSSLAPVPVLVLSLTHPSTSYVHSYGPLNILCYNVGLHQEHHDFPAIPWTRLWKLKALAPEFYDVLPSHSSWPGVTWRFITGASLGWALRSLGLALAGELDGE